MTHDDSAQIGATRLVRRRAFARVRCGVGASRRETMGGVVASGRGRMRSRGRCDRRRDREGNFPACKALKTYKCGKNLDFARAHSAAGGTPGARAAGAARGWRGSRAGRSRPGSRVGGDLSRSSISCTEALRSPGLRRERLKAKVAGGRQMAPQHLEKIESAPDNGMVSQASDPQDLARRASTGRAG